MMTTTGLDPTLNKWRRFRDQIATEDAAVAARTQGAQGGPHPNPRLAELARPEVKPTKELEAAAARFNGAVNEAQARQAQLDDTALNVEGAKGEELRAGLDTLARLEQLRNEARVAALTAEVAYRATEADALTAAADAYRPVVAAKAADLATIREVFEAAEVELALVEQVADAAGYHLGGLVRQRAEVNGHGQRAQERLDRMRANVGA